MKSIWKYELEITDIQQINMPIGAKILTVQMQKERPCIWAIVDTGAGISPRTFYIHGTGHVCKCNESEYIGTFQVYGGDLIFHLFEKNEDNK